MRIPKQLIRSSHLKKHLENAIGYMAIKVMERHKGISIKQAKAQVIEALHRNCVINIIEEQTDYQITEETE